MRFDIMTLFPDLVTQVLGESIIGRAQKSGKRKGRDRQIQGYAHRGRRGSTQETRRDFAHCRELCSVFALLRALHLHSQNEMDKNSNHNSVRCLAWWSVLCTQADNEQLALIILYKNQINYLILITIIKLTVYIIFEFHFSRHFSFAKKV